MRRTLVLIAVAALTLTGCSNAQTADGCASVRKALKGEFQALKNTTQALNALKTSPPANTDPGSRWSFSFDPNKYARLTNLRVSEARVASHLIVNAKACFSPQAVAQAQDFLDSSR